MLPSFGKSCVCTKGGGRALDAEKWGPSWSVSSHKWQSNATKMQHNQYISLWDSAIELFLIGQPRMPLCHYKATRVSQQAGTQGWGTESTPATGQTLTDYFSSWHHGSDSPPNVLREGRVCSILIIWHQKVALVASLSTSNVDICPFTCFVSSFYLHIVWNVSLWQWTFLQIFHMSLIKCPKLFNKKTLWIKTQLLVFFDDK